VLSGLLRAQGGTEDAMRTDLAPGARLVLLDTAILPLPLVPGDLGLPLNWRYGPASRSIGDASYVTATHTFHGRGLLPLSPVHLRGKRDGAGNLQMTWIRRTRLGGDGWEATEVPLAEDEERYEIDILSGLSGTDVVRTIVAHTATATYTAAQQVADHGAPQAAIRLRVAQVSATRGRGTAREITA
jgi:hypothetical protein